MNNIFEENKTEIFGTNISNGPPITYMGGKWRYANDIIAYFPTDVNIYVEPFVGGGSIFFSINQSNYKKLVINDLNDQIVNLFKCLQYDFWRLFTSIVFTSNNLNADINSPDSFVRAASYYVLLTSSFNAQVHSGVHNSRSKLMPMTIINRLMTIRNHLKKAEIWNIDGVECIKENDSRSTLFYIDPPYMIKGAGKYYKESMEIDQHKNLLDTLSNVKGKFVLSYEKTDIMIDIINQYGFNIFDLTITNSSSNTGKKQNEIIATNFERKNIQEELFDVE